MAHDLSFFEKLRGKRTRDINLPAEESQRDPRLLGYEPGRVRKQLGEAMKGYKSLDKTLEGLKKAHK